jgi:hypothetical protein
MSSPMPLGVPLMTHDPFTHDHFPGPEPVPFPLIFSRIRSYP